MEHMPNDSETLLIPKINTVEKYADEKTSSKKGNPRFVKSKVFKIVLTIFVIILVALSVIGLMGYKVYRQAFAVKAKAEEVKQALAANDLDLVKVKIGETRTELVTLSSDYRKISFLKFMPFAGAYVSDGEHAINAGLRGLDAGVLVIDATAPYADILGLKKGSEQAGSGVETAQDRIDFVIKTIPELLPKAGKIGSEVALMQEEIDAIDPNRYPEEFRGIPLRSKIKEGIELIDLGASFVKKSEPLLASASYILGAEDERNYLVIFQNDKELRPTGGFITAYALAKVRSGKFEPVASSDIYSLDDAYKPTIKAPEPIIKYLKGPYTLSPNLRLRDMNWSPDFAESMRLFGEEIQKAGIKDIDGIIAVDTGLLVNLLDVIGPIGVSGFGNFSTAITPECNCPQVIYELESFADIEGPVVWSQDEPGKIIFAPPNYDNRKKIIGPLMNSILANALGQPKDKIPPLFAAGIRSLLEKHVLFYFFDEQAQKAVAEFGIAGTLDSDIKEDYLLVNDANLGGRKSNLYVTQEVLQEIKVNRDKSIEKTVTITYKNPAPHDGWLNSVLPNWVRIYVPKGSELVEFSGIEGEPQKSEDLGKTVFEGFFELRPLGVAKLTLKYKLPTRLEGDYDLVIQKQPGKDSPLYSIIVGKTEEEVFLTTDKRLRYKI